MDNSNVIAFVGMTHLGLNSAVAGAERGFKMLCYDPDSALIHALQAGNPPVQEPQLKELMEAHRARITFTDKAETLQEADVIYVAPDVATDDKGNSDLSVLTALMRCAFDHSRADATVVVLSQVPPGFCRAHARDGRTLIYQVETLIFGQAVARALHPERYIIGLADASRPLPAPYASFLKAHGNPPLFLMRYESAELAKIAINCCLVSSVSTANMLAEICENIGADWADIVPALKADRRIGNYSYLAPGLGISGGNLERDLTTIIHLADEHGTDSGVVRAWVHNSAYRKDWPLRMLHTHVTPHIKNPTIGILGLTYKENTHSVKNSPSLAFIRQITPFSVQAYDPAIRPLAEWHPSLKGADSPLEAARGADVLFVLTAWPEFKKIDPADVAKVMRGTLVIDPFSLLASHKVTQAGLTHITLGTTPAKQAC